MKHALAVEILLGFAVLIAFLSCLGMLLMRDAFQRLHFLAPAASLSPVLITIAILTQEKQNQAGIKSLVVAGVLFLMNAVLSHATGRALRIRELGGLLPRPEQGSIPIIGVDVSPDKTLEEEQGEESAA